MENQEAVAKLVKRDPDAELDPKRAKLTLYQLCCLQLRNKNRAQRREWVHKNSKLWKVSRKMEVDRRLVVYNAMRAAQGAVNGKTN